MTSITSLGSKPQPLNTARPAAVPACRRAVRSAQTFAIGGLTMHDTTKSNVATCCDFKQLPLLSEHGAEVSRARQPRQDRHGHHVPITGSGPTTRPTMSEAAASSCAVSEVHQLLRLSIMMKLSISRQIGQAGTFAFRGAGDVAAWGDAGIEDLRERQRQRQRLGNHAALTDAPRTCSAHMQRERAASMPELAHDKSLGGWRLKERSHTVLAHKGCCKGSSVWVGVRPAVTHRRP